MHLLTKIASQKKKSFSSCVLKSRINLANGQIDKVKYNLKKGGGKPCIIFFKQYSHGLGDAHVTLGSLGGDTAGGNQCLHWLVEEHAAREAICY